MVIFSGLAPTIARVVHFAEAANPAKLPPPTRAAVMMALLGIALLGMLLVVVVLLGGHWVRRQGDRRRGPSVPPDRQPLIQRAPKNLADDVTSGSEATDADPATRETLRDETNDGETKLP